MNLGPSHALYPATQFRNSFGYVPNDYFAGGRATAIAIDPNCAPGHCRLWIFAAGGGVWRTKNALAGQPSWKFLSGPSGSTSGSRSRSIPTTRPATRCTSARAKPTSADRLAPASGCTSPRTAATPGPARSGAAFNGRSIGSIAVEPGDPNTIYAATTRGVLGMSSVSGGRRVADPRSGDVGAVQVHRRRHHVDLPAQRVTTRRPAPVTRRRRTTAAPCSPRGVRRVALDPVEPGDRLCRLVFPRRLALERRRRHLDPDQPVAQRGGDQHAARVRRHGAADGKTRMYIHEGARAAPTRGCSAATTWRPGPRCSRT